MKLLILIALCLFHSLARAREVTIEWEPIPGGAQYQLQVQAPDRTKTVVTLPGDRAEWKGDLPPGDYLYRVRVLDKNKREGEWSAIRRFSVIAASPTHIVAVAPTVSFERLASVEARSEGKATLYSAASPGAEIQWIYEPPRPEKLGFAATLGFRSMTYSGDGTRPLSPSSLALINTLLEARYRLQDGLSAFVGPEFAQALFPLASNLTDLGLHRADLLGMRAGVGFKIIAELQLVGGGTAALPLSSGAAEVSRAFGIFAGVAGAWRLDNEWELGASVDVRNLWYGTTFTSQSNTESRVSLRLGYRVENHP